MELCAAWALPAAPGRLLSAIRARAYLVCLVIGLAPSLAPGAPPASDAQSVGSASSETPTAGQIESKIAEVESATSLNDADKAALTEQYRRALANLESLRSYEERAAEYAKSLETAPKETAEIQGRLDRSGTPQEDDATSDYRKLSAEQIAGQLNKVLADAAIQETRISELEKVIDSMGARPGDARARITALKQSLDEVDTELAQPAAGEQPADAAQARRWALETRRQALWAEGRMLEQELVSQTVREALYKARRDDAARALADLKDRQRRLEDLRNQRRKAEAEEAQRKSEQAQRTAGDKHPAVQALIQDNASISASLTQLAEKLDHFDNQLVDIETARKRVEEDYRGARQRIEAAGLNKALGQLLLDRRNELPDLRKFRKAIRNREDEIAEASLRQIRFREEQRQLDYLDSYLAELAQNDPTTQTPEVRKQLEEAVEQRKSLLAKGLSTEDDYIRQLGELNYASEQLITATELFEDYLSEHLLWVRSESSVGTDTLRALPGGIAWLLSPGNWEEALQVLAYQARTSPSLWLWLVLVAALFSREVALRRAIRATAEPLRRIRTDGFGHTVEALVKTLVVALPAPLAMFAVGQALEQSIEATPFTRALGEAMSDVAFGLYYLRAFRLICMPGGAADRHFQWSPEVLTKLRRNFDWFTALIVPSSLIALTVYKYNDPAYNGSLGRLALVAVMLSFVVFFARLLSPKSGVLKQTLAENPQGLLNRLRNVWYPIVVGAPFAMVVLTLVGYLYTAGTLFESLVQQTWLVLGLVVLHQTIVRWLMVTRRRLALHAAIDRQAARRAKAGAERGDPEAAAVIAQAEETDLDLASLDEQTRKLIGASIFFAAAVGMWLIWSGVLPALHMLDQFSLWHYTGTVDGAEQLIPVTAADVALLLVIVFIAIVAAKNLPALIEIILLQSTSVSAGGRYAIKTLSSYTISAVAFLLVFSTLGLSWSQVQWLVAALGVGIGFGLQEIVANFISGLIILFERPVRVGDVVTIGDTTGAVTNIQIRATTVRNWDKQELLVPNKEFITGRLLNWTLTDQLNRIVVSVGIDYGDDARKALALLAEVAAANERVLKDPAPVISFEGFGDNALLLVLRCYLSSTEHRLAVTTELHLAIDEKFRQHGIGIAYPQRDVHLSATEPLDVRVHRAPRDLGRDVGADTDSEMGRD